MLELLTILLPPLVTLVLTYAVANRRVRLQQTKLMTDMQVKAIEAVTKAESEMREHIWGELDKCHSDSDKIKKENDALKIELEHNEELLTRLKEESVLMKNTIENYQEELTRKNHRIDELENK